MVNGTAMLASPLPTLLTSTAMPAPGLPSGTAETGFAALLSTDATSPQSVDAAQPAAPAEAAMPTGKILPVVLPQAIADAGERGLTAETAVQGDEPAETENRDEPAETVVAMVLPLFPALTPPTAEKAEAVPADAAPPIRPTLPPASNRATPAVVAEQAPRGNHTAETGAPAAAVPIAVSVRSAEPAEAVAAAPEAAARTTRIPPVETSRFDAAPAPHLPATTLAGAPTDQGGRLSPAPAAPLPMSMPSPTEIDAAINRLVAARQALVPASAALAIEHADFGEVSIRFEQAADGRLSAELSSADPVLRDAVTAAMAVERGSTGSDADAGRSGGQAQLRGQAGSDGPSGERGPSPDARNPQQQRAAQGRSQPRPAPNNPHPGIFA